MIIERIISIFKKPSPEYNFNPKFHIPVVKYMLPRPSRKYCTRILHEDNVELPVVTVTLGCLE